MERLLALHAEAIKAFGGVQGLVDPGCPDATLGAAWTAVGYDEIGESLPHLVFAARSLYYFATKQCFADGNKRVAWLAMCETLSRIGLEVDASSDEAIAFVQSVARKETKYEAVFDWISRRVRAVESQPSAVVTLRPT